MSRKTRRESAVKRGRAVAAMASQGWTVAAIAEELGVTERRVVAIAAYIGFQLPKAKQARFSVFCSRAEGETIRALADHLGADPCDVASALISNELLAGRAQVVRRLKVALASRPAWRRRMARIADIRARQKPRGIVL